MNLNITGRSRDDGYDVAVVGEADPVGILHAIADLSGIFTRSLKLQGQPNGVIFEGLFIAINQGMSGPPPQNVTEICVDMSKIGSKGGEGQGQ